MSKRLVVWWLLLAPWSSAAAQAIDTLIKSTARVRVTSPAVPERYNVGRLLERRGDTLFFSSDKWQGAYPLSISGITRLERSGGADRLEAARHGFKVGFGVGAAAGLILAGIVSLTDGWEGTAVSPVEGTLLTTFGYGALGGGIGMWVGGLRPRERWIPVPIGKTHRLSWSFHAGTRPAIMPRLR